MPLWRCFLSFGAAFLLFYEAGGGAFAADPRGCPKAIRDSLKDLIHFSSRSDEQDEALTFFKESLRDYQKSPNRSNLVSLLTDIRRYLDTSGVKYDVSPDGKEFIFSPTGERPLNRLARGILNQCKDCQIIYAPEALAQENSGAFFREPKQLGISHLAIQDGKAGQSEVHELRHLFNLEGNGMRKNGILFQGRLSWLKASPRSRAYNNFFSLDELDTHSLDLVTSKDLKILREKAAIGVDLSKRLANTAKKAVATLKDDPRPNLYLKHELERGRERWEIVYATPDGKTISLTLSPDEVPFAVAIEQRALERRFFTDLELENGLISLTGREGGARLRRGFEERLGYLLRGAESLQESFSEAKAALSAYQKQRISWIDLRKKLIVPRHRFRDISDSYAQIRPKD